MTFGRDCNNEDPSLAGFLSESRSSCSNSSIHWRHSTRFFSNLATVCCKNGDGFLGIPL
ncbi:hypothetical protein C1H46_041262 [Malus baccata]|uniref:Uncharacterized protein n=1 Tax=Malus baccata TaxID=106549 RepID=A0A540KG55_MALBA|nr:hypothetical protein C1H46_041262 [Malus baccata]